MTVMELSSDSRERLGLEETNSGVLVTEVEFNSQAANKGITRDMVITSINNSRVRSIEDWDKAVEGLSSGEVIKLDVLAGRREFTVFLRVPS